jgi:hypothetical protein
MLADWLFIDDVPPVLTRLTALGREVLEPGTTAVRDAVMAFAVRRGCRIIAHGAFADWVSSTVTAIGCDAIISLDRLLNLSDAGVPVHQLHAKRIATTGGYWVDCSWPSDITPYLASARVAIVDDAVASGTTVLAAIRTLAAAGANVTHVVAGVATGDGQARLARRARVRICLYVSGRWNIAHMRDGCPHLPFSGRPSHAPSATAVAVPRAIPSPSLPGSVWHAAALDAAIHTAIMTARRDAVRRLSEAVGRAALVNDLALLGNGVPALAAAELPLTGETPLQALLPAQ